MKFPLIAAAGLLFTAAWTSAAPKEIAFTQSAASVDAYDFVEILVAAASPDVRNPFTDVSTASLIFSHSGSSCVLVWRMKPPIYPGRLLTRNAALSGVSE
jgi:hypothetical protein